MIRFNFMFVMDNNMHPTVLLSVPADLKYSSVVRDTVKQCLSTSNTASTWIYRLVLVVDELFMNAVKYGSASPEDEVTTRISISEEGIFIEVEDSGTGHGRTMKPEDLHAIIDENASNKDLSKDSGRGLAIIAKAFTDEMSILSTPVGGTIIKVYKAFANCTLDAKKSEFIHVIESKRSIEVFLNEELFTESQERNMQRVFTAVEDHKKATFIFNFARMRYLSYINLRIMVDLCVRIKDYGGTFILRNLSPQEAALFNKLQFPEISYF